MLSFDIRSLESQAAQVDGRLAPEDPVWEDGDVRPAKPIQVEGRLSAAGPSRFYFTGRIEGEAEMSCRRCLTDVGAHVEEDAHFIFSSQGEDATDDPDVFPFSSNAPVLDLRQAVREAWLLAVPGFVLCREDCRGICANCGAEWNKESCDCAPATTGNRWDSLKNVRDQLP